MVNVSDPSDSSKHAVKRRSSARTKVLAKVSFGPQEATIFGSWRALLMLLNAKFILNASRPQPPKPLQRLTAASRPLQLISKDKSFVIRFRRDKRRRRSWLRSRFR